MENAASYGLIVRFTLREGSADAFDALVLAMQERIRIDEPDTFLYDFHGVPGDPTMRVLVELYRSREAFDFHERQSHTRVFLNERERHLNGSPDVSELTLLSPLRLKDLV